MMERLLVEFWPVVVETWGWLPGTVKLMLGGILAIGVAVDGWAVWRVVQMAKRNRQSIRPDSLP